MAGRLALLACGGALPVEIARAWPEALRITLKGIPHQLGDNAQEHRIEKLGHLFNMLRGESVERIVLAGDLSRPALNPAEMDAETLALAPRLMTAMQGGDDHILRQVIDIFEEQGFRVIGAHELLPGLTAEEGLCIGTMTEADQSDAERGRAILLALSPLDIGQGCVVAGGLCLGIETVQGTDFLLETVAQTPAHLRRRAKGVFVKAAKRGQDLRVDMPAIGPATVQGVLDAGLAGMVIEAARVMIIDRKNTLQAIENAGLFLTARAM